MYYMYALLYYENNFTEYTYNIFLHIITEPTYCTYVAEMTF